MQNGLASDANGRPVSSIAPRHHTPSEQVLWKALLEDSGTDVAVVDRQGRLRAISRGAGLWPAAASESAVGQPVATLMPPDIAADRAVIIEQVFASMTPVAIDGAWRGIPCRTILRPFLSESGEPLVLAVCRAIPEGAAIAPLDSVPIVKAKVVDEGPLAKLTPREREVLALIAQGHTTAQIAKILFRSAKTIEAHRMSLGLKLRAKNRVELARIAIQAGLHRTTVHGEPLEADERSTPLEA
jgi:DNA-binding CsgD family transcriptional regulator